MQKVFGTNKPKKENATVLSTTVIISHTVLRGTIFHEIMSSTRESELEEKLNEKLVILFIQIMTSITSDENAPQKRMKKKLV